MNLLITGAAGFIGSHAVDHFLENGHKVVGIDNFDPYYPKHFKLNNLKHLGDNSCFSFIEGNICDQQFLESVFANNRFDVIIHLAAKAGVRPSIDAIQDYYHTNVNGTITVLECMKIYDVNKLVFASSSSVYGNSRKVPFSEQQNVDFQISPYASSKKSCELICHVYHHLFGFNINCLRLFTVYGPRQRPDLAIHKFTRLIEQDLPIPFYGDGTTARDYTYITDIINGISKAAEIISGFNIYNIGESKVIYLRDLIKLIETYVGKKAVLNKLPMQAGDVKITYAEINKAKDILGYRPVYDIETGIQNFVTWYQDNKLALYH